MTSITTFSLLGGLALFIYGMKLMGDSLQKVVGDRLKKILEAMTANRLFSVIVGAGITAIIQSSSATTVMTVGFVNAGIMNLFQAGAVIMGANIGTTITPQLIAFNLSSIAPLIIALGASLTIFSRKKRIIDIGGIILGFGILFLGMSMMEDAMKILSELASFKSLILTLGQYPAMGIFVGLVMTAVIQSSSATIGILAALAAGNGIPLEVALPILFGDNIGTCVTALISSIGTTKNAKRTALIHLTFNIIGTIIFMSALSLVLKFIPMLGGDIKRQIANSHTFFNVTNVLIQVWFIGLLVKFVNWLVPGKDVKAAVLALEHLDTRLLETPSIAVGQVVKEVVRMGRLATDNLENAMNAFVNSDEKLAATAVEYEEVINFLEREITSYMVSLSNLSLSEHQSEIITSLFHVVNDIERVGDHADNLRELAIHRINNRMDFSSKALDDLNNLYVPTKYAIETAVTALETVNAELAEKVIEVEGKIDAIERQLRLDHVDRLNKRECNPSSGTVFLDIIANLERVGDHANNIAQAVIEYQ